MRIARLIALTVVAVALILGAAIIIAAYLQTRHTVTTTNAPAATETIVSSRFFSFNLQLLLMFASFSLVRPLA